MTKIVETTIFNKSYSDNFSTRSNIWDVTEAWSYRGSKNYFEKLIKKAHTMKTVTHIDKFLMIKIILSGIFFVESALETQQKFKVAKIAKNIRPQR